MAKFNPLINKGDVIFLGGYVYLQCLCGADVQYKSTQKKRIDGWIKNHKKRCTKKRLIHLYNWYIERFLKDIVRRKKIIKKIKDGSVICSIDTLSR